MKEILCRLNFKLYDYYLMKVSKVPFQLERVENDDWGNTFPVGANVVRGY
jgi:hypothetical protein